MTEAAAIDRRPGGGGSLVSHAVQAVRAHIRSHGLKVGDALPGEGHFAETVGVSRAVIREAFGALAALRLIDVGNGRRARVGAIDGSVIATSLDHAVATAQISVADVWEVRRALELRTAALAARNRSQAQAAHIVELAEAMAELGGAGGDVTRLDIDFHEAIALASGNVLFVQIVTSFAPMMESAVPAAWRTRTGEEQRAAILQHHLALAQAIADRDDEGAEKAMSTHFDAAIGDQLRAAEPGPSHA